MTLIFFGVEPELLNDTQQSLNSGKRIKIDINQPQLMRCINGTNTWRINIFLSIKVLSKKYVS